MAERRVFNGIGNGRKFKTGRYVYDKKLKKLILATDRVSMPGLLIRPDIKEFVTDNITGEPVNIHGRRQKKELMKLHGVVEYEPTLKDKRDAYFEESHRIIESAKKNLGMQDNVQVGYR